MTDLEEVISMNRESLSLRLFHPDRSISLTILGLGLSDRFRMTLTKLFSLHRESLALRLAPSFWSTRQPCKCTLESLYK